MGCGCAQRREWIKAQGQRLAARLRGAAEIDRYDRMRTFSGHKASQRADELPRFIDLLQRMGCRSYLEIGARHGDTFHAVMSALPPGSCGVAVDLPGGAWGSDGTDVPLANAAADLRARGYSVALTLGDSGAPATVEACRIASPNRAGFDACLIDGDHRYDAVMRDFAAYSQLARIVALHDIAGDGVLQKSSGLPVEVPRAWAEIKRLGPPCIEIIGAERGMGIGVICMDPDLAPLFEGAAA